MKSLLFIGHTYHQKTKSAEFIQKLLAEKFDVNYFYFDPYKDDFSKFAQLKGNTYDILILFQIMPSLKELSKYIKFKHSAVFPMYDDTPNVKRVVWSEFKNTNIINFSKALHQKCLDAGLSSYYIQYFPEPIEIADEGDLNSIFFWERRESISTKTLEKLVDSHSIKNLYLHRAADPENTPEKPSYCWKDKIIYSDWFDTKDEMKKYIQKSALYMAPREEEGIGMSFLEAMAVGRCVIAPDNPTMNEYIENGVTGYLYNLKHPNKINLKNVREIQKTTAEYIKEGYQNWNKEKYKILDWIEATPQINKNLMDKKLFVRREKAKLFKFIPARIYETGTKITYKAFNIIPITITKHS